MSDASMSSGEGSPLRPEDVLPPGNHFVTGDEAIAYGAIYAGCSYFGGYPITPASEIAEVMAEELPKIDGRYVQMEDELASIAAVIGASWAGRKAMTATSGPGFSLMQENLGYAVMTETPMVLADVQRSGPSTGQATLPAQGDLQQARWGTHGDHPIVALSPASVQEAFDLTVRAFEIAETYRTPVIVLADGAIGHASERLHVPETVETTSRTVAAEGSEIHFGDADVAPMPEFGDGHYAHVTGSAHRPDGIRDYSPEVHDEVIRAVHEKIEGNMDDIIESEAVGIENASELVVSFGITGRIAEGAVRRAREAGSDIGLLRLQTVWPFPEATVAEAASDVDRVYVPEMNLGQLVREVRSAVDAPVESIDRIGGVPFTVDELAERIGGESA